MDIGDELLGIWNKRLASSAEDWDLIGHLSFIMTGSSQRVKERFLSSGDSSAAVINLRRSSPRRRSLLRTRGTAVNRTRGAAVNMTPADSALQYKRVMNFPD